MFRQAPTIKAGVLVLAAATLAQAQNNKPVRSGTWYEDRASVNVSATSITTLAFSQSPGDAFLNITNVACNIQVPTNQVVDRLYLQIGTTRGVGDTGRTYDVLGSATPQANGTYKKYSVVTNGIFFKVGQGRYPSLVIYGGFTGNISPFISADCTIVGNLSSN